MNKKQKACVFCGLGLVVLANLAPLLLHGSRTARGRTLSVSIPNLQVSAKERVVGFEVHIASGRIAALPNIPIGWNMSIDNDPSWNAKIEGSLRVAAAAVTPSFFCEFLFIERDQSPEVPFRIWGDIVVTEDFTAERHIPIASKDLVLRESAAPNCTASR